MTSTSQRKEINHAFGIDIGGSGIKGALVDLNTGEFVGDRLKIATPQPATPEAVADVVAQILEEKGWDGPVGITVPAVVKDQVVLTAANIDKSWIDVNAQELFSAALGGREFTVLNDADAAGIAEVAYGEESTSKGPVLFLTLGTGIGSALLLNGELYPNSELGHLTVGKKSAELQASSAVREREGLKYKQWAKRVTAVLNEYEKLFHPQTFVIGGGISRKFEKWGDYLKVETPVVPAKLRNTAGIVGAAMAVTQGLKP